MSRYSYNPYRSSFWDDNAWWVITLGVIVAIIGFAWWFVAGAWLDRTAADAQGFGFGVWTSWFFPNGWNILMATPAFWALVIIAISIGLAIWAEVTGRAGIAWTLVIALIIGWIFHVSIVSWRISEDGARYYLSTTEFQVRDTQASEVPTSLRDMAGEQYDQDAMIEISQGDLPSAWVPRVASATGAVNVMKKTGDAINNTQLMDDTVTYLYDLEGSGKWTAIRNGQNLQAVFGVSSWDGSPDNVQTCEFTGEYELNKAFGGYWGTNLWNVLATKYPHFQYNESDLWGYCDGDEPIMVLPGTTTVGYQFRTVDEAVGVLVIQGSPSGEPELDLRTDVGPGDFPGPVYPQRLVNNQRDYVSWAAGRHLNMFKEFGFEGTDVSSQEGNNFNYLMKSEKNDRLYWVTPMKSRSTESQTLVAYSVIPADEVHQGKLNEQIVYVLDENDRRVVNLDDLLARVTDAVRDANPGFFTGENPGKIVEFLPVSDTEWQVFAEVNGRVKYRIDVNVSARIIPDVVNVDIGDGSEGVVSEPGSPDATCDDPATLSDEQLAACLVDLTVELESRLTEEVPQ